MRLICVGIVFAMTAFALAAVLPERTLAQIPERVIFQPGSYAGGAYGYGRNISISAPAVSAVPKTEWETVFGEKQEAPAVPADISAAVAEKTASETKPAPYLAYHKNPFTGRINIIPYQKGYPDPEEFPKKESHLKFALSALPCMTQDQPQIEYLGYYDPMPEIIEDKPSRLHLILGYPNSNWTSSCDNRWGIRQAQCIGIEQFAHGPYAEWSIRNQNYDLVSPQSQFGPLQPNAGGFRGNLFFNHSYPAGVQTPLPAGYPMVYPQGIAPEGYRPRLFSRLGSYQPAVGERCETSGYNHSWCSSCGKQNGVCPLKDKDKCQRQCQKCSKKECKAGEPACSEAEKTEVKKEKQDEKQSEKQKKSVAPPKKSSR